MFSSGRSPVAPAGRLGSGPHSARSSRNRQKPRGGGPRGKGDETRVTRGRGTVIPRATEEETHLRNGGSPTKTTSPCRSRTPVSAATATTPGRPRVGTSGLSPVPRRTASTTGTTGTRRARGGRPRRRRRRPRRRRRGRTRRSRVTGASCPSTRRA